MVNKKIVPIISFDRAQSEHSGRFQSIKDIAAKIGYSLKKEQIRIIEALVNLCAVKMVINKIEKNIRSVFPRSIAIKDAPDIDEISNVHEGKRFKR